MTITEAIRKYVEHGFTCFPVRIVKENDGIQKKPLVEWKKYQAAKPTSDELKQWENLNANGVAVLTGKVNNLIVIDLDRKKFKKLDDYLKKKEELETLLPDSFYFPIVITPSGGEHWWFRLGDKFIPSLAQVDGWIDVLSENKVVIAPPSAGYIGDIFLDIDKIPEIPDKLYMHFLSKAKKENVSIPNLKFEKGSRDNNMFTVAYRMLKAGFKVEDVFNSMMVIANGMDTSDIKNVEVWVKQKIQSALKRIQSNEQVKTITAIDEILQFARDVKEFTLTECVNATQVKMATAGKLLIDLAKRGLIEKVGRGLYRYVEDIETIELSDKIPDAENVNFPLELEQYFNVYMGNIILLAGVPNAGKTAFALNFAYMNRDNYQVHYFSSEMGKEELAIRLSKHPPIEEWKKIKFYNFSSVQIDVIRRIRNGLVVIDYLDITTDFYEIATHLKKLHEILHANRNIAFVCIQKDSKKELGRGASLALEKPRVYMTMDRGILRIVKAKNWRNKELNPNGMEINFKLINGIHFITTGVKYHGQDNI